MTPRHFLSFAPTPCLYKGQVTHVRSGAVEHRLSYKVTSILLPLHRLDEADQSAMLFSINRFNAISFHESDHMENGFDNLTIYVQHQLTQSGLFTSEEPLPNRISILAFPRMLGHAFNPIAIFFCCDEKDQLQAILYQVNNTFGQRHHYLYRLSSQDLEREAEERFRHEGDKHFYVSPFLDMAGRYRFSIKPPQETASYQIEMSGDQPSSLTAVFVAKRQAFTSANLMRSLGRLGQTGFKILAAIHIEALKLLVKGAQFHRKPPLPSHSVTPLNRPSVGKGPSL